MKQILITGAGSYIGISLENWLLNSPEKYELTTIDMKDPQWKNEDFSKYDVVFHVAGIAHSDTGNANEETKKLYYKVNTDLTVEVAQKAKDSGVKQFIYMSSMIVYGESGGIGEKKVITRDTVPTPANFYGDSKLQAEKGIQKLEDDNFRIVILRPPMIYGKGSKGNYPILAKMARKLPIFPDINNERSMLYIGNLCEFIRLIINNQDNGIFFPQNERYVKTSEMVRQVASAYNKKLMLTKIFNPFIRILGKKSQIVNKAFGNLSYSQNMSEYKDNYQIFDLKESIMKTEG